jgi:3-deoxy-manno-octulosonate cytidylyltransferase (CMP-KDO synthetase)
MKVLIVIPSRYGSTRFEGKPLIDIAGKSLVRRTYEQALKANIDSHVVVATDDERIFKHVSAFGNCIMTSPDHVSGTDRCFEAVQKTGREFDVLLNLQGDEPFILPSQIESLVHTFESLSCDIATLQKPIKTTEELVNTNIVKVVCNRQQEALYFSRQPIPFIRSSDIVEWTREHSYFRHIGMYGFRFSVIEQLKKLQPAELETCESLEQLRWLENGFKIRVVDTDFVSPAIDTPEDLLTVDNFLKSNPAMV